MSDLIDRQAAIEALDDVITITGVSNAYVFKDYVQRVRRKLEQLPSAQPDIDEWCTDCKEYDHDKHCCPRWNRVIKTTLADVHSEQRWIPCSERLPKPDQICIVTDDKRLGAYEYGFHSENHDEIDGWTFMGRKIIAWMPLPEPYKGEQE